MKNHSPITVERMKDDRVALGSFNTHANHVHDSHNDNSKKNITDNRHFGDKIGTINHQASFPTAQGLHILQENAVPGAAYDSSECQSTPVCPRTRTVVLDRVEKWADARDDCAICWMHGPAGIGKTSLATSIAMKYAKEKRLAGSFFFSRDPACDAGRRSVHKIFATIAYQISTSHPTAKKKLRDIIDKDPLILNNSLEHQFSHLIIAPFQPFRSGLRFFVTLCTFFLVTALSSITPNAPREHIKTLDHRLPKIVVIDALDECSEDVVALIKVLAHVYRDSPPPIRFFLTSRPEDHIRGKFRIPSYSQRTHFIDLNDFQAQDDIRIFLQVGFSALHIELQDYMPGVGTPWPSPDDLETLVEKSEGLFIYASTLLKFVGDVEDQGQSLPEKHLKKSLPQERLRKAIKRHDGLDGLYRQVLGDAPFRSYPNFDVLLGAMCFLYDPLGMDVLTDLLQFNDTGETRLLLRGCRSILRIPDNDTDEISFFHASLRDFLTDQSRSRDEFFLDPVIQHIRLLDRCIRAIATSEVAPTQDSKPAISYAWRNWHHHMHAALQNSNPFEADLVHFLESIATESSNLCDTWKLLLQRRAIEQHDGLDDLYRQVLRDAPFRSDPKFDVLFGAMCFLYDPLGMDDLTDLLRFNCTDETRLLLQGCRSILRVPESDTEEISFFHASSRDFLTDQSRSRDEYFLDPVIQHSRLLDHCIRAIARSGVTPTHDLEPWISYAWENWHRHMQAALQSSSPVHHSKGRLAKRFGAGLVHFLESIVSESSNLCDTWELLLQKQAIEQHDGLDDLYRQVLRDAPFRSDPKFDVLLGARCYLYDPLGMDVFTNLLQFNGTDETRLLLQGCRSILRVPESDTDEISFFHASLRDFLIDQSRSRDEYFLDPVIQHIRLLDRCIRAIATSEVAPTHDLEPWISYAWKNWHRHMHAALQSSSAVHHSKGRLGERFEAGLIHFLESIVSESFHLCDTWKLLLQKRTIEQHDGLDDLYRQVLRDAPFRSDPKFDILLGAMCFLYDPLGMDDLTDLLRFNGTDKTRLLLQGCKSILQVPASDPNEISFFHMSLWDFLTDGSRSQEEFFLDPVIQHIRLLDHCIQLIATRGVASKQDIKPSISYAWKNWHRHMHAALRGSSAVLHSKGRLVEVFEADLVHFLESIVSESSNLCHTWKLLLQKRAIEQHDGLDDLYRQVLRDAPFRSDPEFDILLGAICFLYDPLGMDDLTDLLQFNGTGETRLLLQGCKSILQISESDSDEISFFDASLRDFLTDESRARGEYFLDPVTQHIRLLDHCIEAITTSEISPKQDIKPSISYAWKNWHRHLHAALKGSNSVHCLKAHLGERFEAGLVHFLDSIVSESSTLCDTWERVLQKQRVSWRQIAPVLEDMVQDTTLLFPMFKIRKMVKFLGRNSTLHWRTARVIFDQINDNLNITLVGVDETQLDLKQLFTRLEEPAAKLPSLKYLEVKTGGDNLKGKLRRSVNIAFTLTTASAESSIASGTIIWKILRFEKEATILHWLVWSSQSAFSSFQRAPDGTLIPVANFFSGGPGLGEVGELDGGLDEPKKDIFIYGVPAMLQAYVLPDKPGYEERQLIDVNGLDPLLEEGAIDIRKLAGQAFTTFCLHSTSSGEVRLERELFWTKFI